MNNFLFSRQKFNSTPSKFVFVVAIFMFISGILFSQILPKTDHQRGTIIENFDDGDVELFSYPDEDLDPSDWEFSDENTYENSLWSLKLFGNTWKTQSIPAITIDSGDVWQVSAYIDSQAEIQGFGIMDTENVLFYSFAGSEEVDIEKWVAVYQGSFPEKKWNEYQLPVADDWLAKFGYLPEIITMVYINDRDDSGNGVVYFDQIIDITSDIPVAPDVTVDFTLIGSSSPNAQDVQFYSEVLDVDSETHNYFWDFGDGFTSSDQNPVHTFNSGNQHTVLLQVVDSENKWGYASCHVEVNPGGNNNEVSMNFVGDIMMARKYEQLGGIIPTQGVEAIFEPTLPFLGEAADITIANLECPLTTSWENHPTKSIYFKSSPNNVDGLTYAGIDIVTLANNHILDYMLPGLQETQTVLTNNDIVYSGAGENSYEAYLPVFYSKSGINFAFLAASDRTGQYNNYQPYLHAGWNKPGFANLDELHLKKQIDEVKEVADFVVMEWHCGKEYSFTPIGKKTIDPSEKMEDEGYFPLTYSPSIRNREIRQFAIDNGADLVICHHPHITQGLEIYKGKLIAHSLGDFVFDLEYPETLPSMILNAKVNESGFYEFEITPIFIDDYIPKRATGGLGLHILDDLAHRSRTLDTYLKVDRENVIAEVIMDPSLMTIYETDYEVELLTQEEDENWITKPFRLNREGSISKVNFIQPDKNQTFRLGQNEIWYGNMEDEGSTMWNLNNSSEVYVDTVSHSGKRSIQHQRNSGSPFNLVTNLERRIIRRVDTLKYVLCGYIKTENAKNVTIEVQYYQTRTGGFMLADENIGIQVEGDTPWTFYYQELTIPDQTKYFDIRLNSGIPEADTSWSWFDDVNLVLMEPWDKYDIGQPIPFPNDYYFIQAKSSQDVSNIDLNYTQTSFDAFYVDVQETEEVSNSTKDQIRNYPNPFDPSAGPTTISFELEQAAKVGLTIFDLKGSAVKILSVNFYISGLKKLSWDGTNNSGQLVGSGIYFYELKTPTSRLTGKCIILSR